MTLYPPSASPRFAAVDIPVGMVPLLDVITPNYSKPLLWRNPFLGDASDRNMTITVLSFHNTSTTNIYIVSWALSYSSLTDYSPGGAQGSSDLGIQKGYIEIPIQGIATFDDPVVLAPNMGIFAFQAKKGAPFNAAGPTAVTAQITGQWGPSQ